MADRLHTTDAGTRVKEEALPRLLNLLSPIVHNWGMFALQIGVPSVQISQIQAANLSTNPSYLYTSLSQALQWWIANCHSPTYEVIVTALDPKLGETTPVMNRVLANQVREFMAKELAPLSLPAATSPYSGNPGDQGSAALSDYTKRNTKMIQTKFAKLHQKVCQMLQVKLSKKKIKENLCLFLISILPSEYADRIPKSSDLKKIFEAMTCNGLWDFKNYFPLESVIEEFGDGDADMIAQMQQFKKDRSSFQLATKIKDYIPAVRSLLSESSEPVESAPLRRDRKYFWKLEMKLNECVADESLAYLEQLWSSLASILSLPPVSLVLDSILSQSIIVTWLIPAKLGPKAVEIAHQSSAFFRSYPILSVTIGDECVYEADNDEKVLSLKDVNTVRKEIYAARAKWQDIALELGMPLDTVDNIKSRYSEDKDCLLEALRWWLMRANPKPGWSDLINALRSPIVDEHHIADDLQKKYNHQATALIDPSDLEFGEKVGMGGTGIVYKGWWKSRQIAVAIKTAGEINEMEVKHLSSLNHQNIVTFYGAAIKMPHYYIVTEFAEHQSLHDYLHKKRFQVDYQQRLKWAMQIADGMNYLHKMKIMHRDLKPHNVLVTEDLTAKICDFSAAKSFEHTTAHTMTGTFRWMAPEVLNEEPYSLKCDVFSYGMILYELIVCKEPFSEVPALEAVTKIRNAEKPDIPDTCEPFLATLLTKCWEKDPKARPTFAKIMSILDSKGFQDLSTLFLQSLQKMIHSMPNVTDKVKSALSSLTLLHEGKAIPLVDSAAYKEARTIPELMKSLSPYWNCLSTGVLETVVKSSDCSASASALHDITSARGKNGHLVLAAQAGTTSDERKDHHSDFFLSHKSAQSGELQSCQPAIFARLTEHRLCASVNVTRISVEVATDVLHLSDYDNITDAVAAFFKLPVAALVYCGCLESPLAVCWEVSRAQLAHITSVVPSNSLYRQLAKQNIIRLAVGDSIKYSCPSIKDVELWETSSKGNTSEMLDRLKSATVDVVDYAGFTALVEAASSGQTQAAELLIRRGANLNHQTKTGSTPLYMAAQKGHSNIVELLLGAGADVNLQFKIGDIPLTVAAQNGHKQVVELLLSKGSKINHQRKDGGSPIFMASQNNHQQVVQLLLDNGADINLQTEDGMTPLSRAAIDGHTTVVQQLLRAGASTELQYKSGETALHWASLAGHIEIVESLLGAGANVHQQNKNRQTALDLARIAGHAKVCEVLRNHC